MLRFTVTRVAGGLLVLVFLTAVVFILQEKAPFDPARAMAGSQASAAAVAEAREQLRLDDPLPAQYVRYVGNLVQGDLSMSLVTRRPVATDLGEFLPASLELTLFSLGLAILFGGLFGFSTAVPWKGSGLLRFVMMAGASVPIFLVALVGVLVSYKLMGGFFPASGRASPGHEVATITGFVTVDGILAGRPDVVLDGLRHLLLPAIALSVGPAVAIGRVFRSSLMVTMRQGWIQTARAKGLGETAVVARHAVRNSVNAALSIGGIQVAFIFGNLVVIEKIFAWPGVGLYTAEAVSRGDFPAIGGIMLVFGVLYVITTVFVDLAQAAADPRIHN